MAKTLTQVLLFFVLADVLHFLAKSENDQHATIDQSDERYEAYTKAVSYLNYSMDLSADPCNQFYEYACGNYKKLKSFTTVRENNNLDTAQQLEHPKYKRPNAPKPLQQTIWFYEKCKEARANYDNYIKEGHAIREIMNSFSSSTGLVFSMVTMQNQESIQNLTPEILGKALGILSRIGVDTLVTPSVSPDLRNPKTYKFYLDQNQLYYSKSYYKPKAWNTIKVNHTNDVVQLLQRYAEVLKVRLDKTTLLNDVQKLLEFEILLANQYSINDLERRRNLTRIYTAHSTHGNYSFINFTAYFKALSGEWTKLHEYFSSSNLSWYLIEPEQLNALDNGFRRNQIDKNIVINYLFYRLLGAYKDYLPNFKPNTRILQTTYNGVANEHLLRTASLGPIERLYEDSRIQCAYETQQSLQYANGRFFLDNQFLNGSKRKKTRNGLQKLFEQLIKSFEDILHRLSWFDTKTFKRALSKISALNRNFIAPEFLLNNQKLHEYYDQLNITKDDSYIEMRRKISEFNFMVTYQTLLDDTVVDRSDFNGPPATANAWYSPELNSITLPAGILKAPFFDVNWPASMNYGGIGIIAGHEISHAFDEQGIQWDSNGELTNWMSDSPKESFIEMIACIIDEYNNFCPLSDTGMFPECLDGYNTRGENVADNGGIRAAWNSYKSHVATNGQDPSLPDKTFGKLSHDQLFFLSFAHIWCEKPASDSEIYSQIMTDPHSPPKYRVLGTLQNFPPFKTAFNCPKECLYGPAKHCSVWAEDDDS